MALITREHVASKYRYGTRHSYWSGQHKKILMGVVMPFVVLQLLFLGLQAYMYGSVYHSDERVHQLHFLAVDYDGGIVGRSLEAAYTFVEGDDFPSLRWHTPNEYRTPQDIREAVCSGKFWAGIYAFDGASDRLAAAIGDNATARAYQPQQALGYVYNEARYPTVAEGDIVGNIQKLVGATRVAYNRLNGTAAMQSIPSDDTASIMVVLDPIEATAVNIKPLSAGSKVFYNTVGQVFTVLLQFFFLMAFNGVAMKFQLFSKMPVWHHIGFRAAWSVLYTFIGSLCVTANIYAFRESTNFSGGQFMLLWMAFWLEMHVLFLVLEVATSFLDSPFLPMFVVTFIIVNVTSCVMPFDLNPGFYKWGFALPCHQMYSLEITIMSGGCNNNLDIALPVLFAWWILLVPLSVFAIYWRASKAALADKEIAEAIAADAKGRSDSAQDRQQREMQLARAFMDAGRAEGLPTGLLGFRDAVPLERVVSASHQQEEKDRDREENV